MKKISLTLKLIVAVVIGLVSILALRAIAYEKHQREKKPPFEVCITDPVTVSNPKKLKKWLADNVGRKNYKIRIKKVAGQSNDTDEVDGDLEECTAQESAATADAEPSTTPSPSATPGGGAQVTQHLRLRTVELKELAAIFEATPTPTPKSSP